MLSYYRTLKRFKSPPFHTNRPIKTQIERFDANFQLQPFNIFQILSGDRQYAICTEPNQDIVFVNKSDKKNKYQWFTLDQNTGAFIFLNDLKSYFNIKPSAKKEYDVIRSDVSLNRKFEFKTNKTINLKGRIEVIN